MDHPTDKQLELWLRSRDDLERDEAASITGHLSACHLCAERVQRLEACFRELDRELSRPPGEREHAIASKIYRDRTKAALSPASLIQTYEAPLEKHRHTLPSRLVSLIRRHPVGSAAATGVSVFFAVLLIFIQPWTESDQNPVYAEVERNVLHAYNKNGERLWNRLAAGLPNEISSEDAATRSTKRYIRITDLDGDGKNEILLTGNDATGEFTTGTLYCFNSDGTLRWQQTPPPPVLFGQRTHSLVATWKVTDFFTIEGSGDAPRLFVTANTSWFPSVLFEVDAHNGDILQAYWHAGWIFASAVIRDKDENNRIVLGTTNNTYQHAALSVLDPENINGHAPVQESYTPEGLSPAAELHYMMFPPSTLHRLFSTRLYNDVSGIQITGEGGVIVRVREDLQKIETSVDILYTLGNDFTVLEARGSGVYEKLYTDYYEEGLLDEPWSDRYWKNLKDAVLYWDGERFVNK